MPNAPQKRYKMMHYIDLPEISDSDFSPMSYNSENEIEHSPDTTPNEKPDSYFPGFVSARRSMDEPVTPKRQKLDRSSESSASPSPVSPSNPKPFRWNEVARASPEAIAAYFREQDRQAMIAKANNLPPPVDRLLPIDTSSTFAFKRRATVSDFPPRRNQIWKGNGAYQSFGQAISSASLTPSGISTPGNAWSHNEPTKYTSTPFSAPPGLSGRGRSTSDYTTPRRVNSTPLPSNSLLLQSDLGQSKPALDFSVHTSLTMVDNQGFNSERSSDGIAAAVPSLISQIEDGDDDWEDIYV
ncbi:hypothetical protein JR316_0008934 [Psilocybe cubensis]|nr:hypothetical protein JR316_0008934 [Psilocybe cubensis]KAH9478479.1 hypothetical protein JR316_0008934 [Psilocybe cubensis]